MHKLKYFRLNFRYIDFAEHIHLPGFIKYELLNGWLFTFEGLPEPGDCGEFLILFINEDNIVFRELTLIIDPPIDIKEYNKFKKERIALFFKREEIKEELK